MTGPPVPPEEIDGGAADHPAPSRSRRRWRWIIVAGAVLFGAVALLTGTGVIGGSSRSGRAAPPFRLPRLDDPGRTVALADYRGHPLVVNFWASWCVPCQKEMPDFQAAATDLEGRVAFLGVNEQDGRDSALAFLAKTGVRYPSAFDPGGTMRIPYGLRGLPGTAFISSTGELLDFHLGQLSGPDLRATIDRLFGGSR